MEYRILNAATARATHTAGHFIGAKRNHAYIGDFQQFTNENSLQYNIPAIGHHYGNAFAPDEEDDDDEDDEEGSSCLATANLNVYSSQSSANMVSTTDGECCYEDEEEMDEDVEMSPAIEVISIDPNCEYDSDEEEEHEIDNTIEVVEQHHGVTGQEIVSNNVPGLQLQLAVEEPSIIKSITVQETVVEGLCAQVDEGGDVIDGLESDDIEPELENIHRDSEEDSSDNDSSSDSDSSSNSSSDSDSSRNSRSRNRSTSSSSSSSSNSSTSSASSHPSDFVHQSDGDKDDFDTHADQQDSLAKVIERRKLIAIERRKRTTSTNRKSFSLPQSPVGAATGSILHDMTSLSFEDLDVSAIVNELSPLKIPVRASESDDKLVQELAESNFDLAAYITEDDFVTTDSEKRETQNVKPKSSPVKKVQKSRGKQLKVLRELMLSPKRNKEESGFSRRTCTNKTRRIVEESESESEPSESESDTRTCVKIFGIEKMIGKPKRKDDDTKADPTWNPNGTGTAKPAQRVAPIQKPCTAIPVGLIQQTNKKEISDTKSQSTSGKTMDSTKPVNNTSVKNKLLSAGSQLARNKMLSLMAKTKPSVQPAKPQSKASGVNNSISSSEKQKSAEQSKKKSANVNNNVKLDHDYCSPKKGSSQTPSAPVPQRKAIEIPFLLPTMDQLRQKKKLSKTKKCLDAKSKNKPKIDVDCDRKESTKSNSIQRSYSDHGNVSAAAQLPSVKEESIAVKEEPKEQIDSNVNIISVPLTQPKQVSLLKINQNKPNGVQINPVIEGTIKLEQSHEKIKSEPINATLSSSNESLIKVKKKLNLQEYKKRREHPSEELKTPIPTTESSSKSSIPRCSATVYETSNKEELSNLPAEQKISQPETQSKAACKAEPLDPISAAKLKALRMQQLKKEAAIKSTEAKIIPKTVPQIVPLVEITSIKFDEHGNPMPYDKNAEQDASELKLHKDFEEVIIVSMGCNTEITINPHEMDKELVKTEQHEKHIPRNELLSNITDTIKRCQSSAPAIISSSSLISSIHEVVIRKKSCKKTDTNEVSTASSAEKRTVGGGQASQQGSPNVGVSPPNTFSPGKPEKAGGAYDQSPSFDYDEGQLQQTIGKSKSVDHGEDKIIMHLRKDRQRFKGVSIAIQTVSLDRFPELKRLSPSKKERTVSRSSCGSVARSVSRQSAGRSRDRTYRQYRRRRSQSSSSESEARIRQSNNARNNKQRPSSRRSRSRCSSTRRRSHSRSRSRSRSYRRRSRSNSHRRRSSISSERRRFYERDYNRRCRSSRRQRSRSNSSQYSSSSSFSSRSRSRSVSHSSRSRSRSMSRPASRVRNASRNDFRRPAQSPERKIVYVGRLEPALKREDLKRKFMQYGRIKQVTLHYKESGAKYGFVTFEKPQDAYKAIDSSSKDPALSEYDVSFGGRRAFCRTEYADLGRKPQVSLRKTVLKKMFLRDGDLSQDQEAVPYIAPDGSLLMTPNPIMPQSRKNEGESFEELLKKLKKEISAKKPRKS